MSGLQINNSYFLQSKSNSSWSRFLALLGDSSVSRFSFDIEMKIEKGYLRLTLDLGEIQGLIIPCIEIQHIAF